ncbi:MAG TPA: hypothetical protein PLB55_25550, partial [Prosthecobacter sp.]|nr:hypothetical protein [Prosthecobacter sp.]
WRIHFGALGLKMRLQTEKVVPFVECDTVVITTPLVRTMNQDINAKTLVFQITKPREVIRVLMCDKDTSDLFCRGQKMFVLLDTVTVDQEGGGVGSDD